MRRRRRRIVFYENDKLHLPQSKKHKIADTAQRLRLKFKGFTAMRQNVKKILIRITILMQTPNRQQIKVTKWKKAKLKSVGIKSKYDGWKALLLIRIILPSFSGNKIKFKFCCVLFDEKSVATHKWPERSKFTRTANSCYFLLFAAQRKSWSSSAIFSLINGWASRREEAQQKNT